MERITRPVVWDKSKAWDKGSVFSTATSEASSSSQDEVWGPRTLAGRACMFATCLLFGLLFVGEIGRALTSAALTPWSCWDGGR